MAWFNSIILVLFCAGALTIWYFIYRDEHKRLVAERTRIEAQTLFIALCCEIAKKKRVSISTDPADESVSI